MNDVIIMSGMGLSIYHQYYLRHSQKEVSKYDLFSIVSLNHLYISLEFDVSLINLKIKYLAYIRVFVNSHSRHVQNETC